MTATPRVPSPQEMVALGKEQTGYKVPGIFISAAIKMVRQSVMKKAKMDINKLKPIQHVDKCVASPRCPPLHAHDHA